VTGSGWRTTGRVITAFLLLAGWVSVWSWLGRQDETQQGLYERPIERLTVDLASGGVTITAGPADRVTIQRRLTWSYGEPVIKEDWTGAHLHVRAACDAVPRLPGCAVSYQIQVPPNVIVDLRTGNGALAVQSLTGALTLNTRSGDVRLTDTAGPVRIQARSGSVTGGGLRSTDVSADVGSGSVDLRFSVDPASVRAAVNSGDVTVMVPPGPSYDLHASTRSGTRNVTVREDPSATRIINVDTGDGDVRIGE
jgi:hypothetical protein